MDDATKVCSKCREPKLLSEFGRQTKNGKGYLRSVCKKCHSAASRLYELNHPEEVSARRKQYYAATREKSLAKSKRWAETHIEEANAIKNKWAAAHPEEVKATTARSYLLHKSEHLLATNAWREKNRPQVRAAARTRYALDKDKAQADLQARRARRRAAFVERVIPSLVFERDGWICQICLKKVDKNVKGFDGPSVDHVIPISLGGLHCYVNCVLAHRRCNSRKGNRPIPQQQRLFG